MNFTHSGRTQQAIFSVLVFAASLCLLLCFNSQYLRLIEGFTLFLPGSDFFADMACTPGGALQWVGAYMTQWLFHPALGASIYAAMLLGLMWLAYGATGLPRRWFAACGAVPALLLLSVLQLGYIIFSNKAPGFVYADALGVAFALAALWGCRIIPLRWLRLTLIPVLAIALYPVLGVYAFLASALCALHEARISTPLFVLVPVALAALAIFFAPRIFFYCPAMIVPKQMMYTLPLTELRPGEWLIYIPYMAIFAVLALAVLRPRLPFLSAAKQALASAIVLLAAFVATFVFRCSDPNFHLTAELYNALMADDFNAAIEARAKYPDLVPTRANVQLTNCAMWRLNIFGDRAFTFPHGGAAFSSSRSKTAMRDISAMLLPYHMGRVNNAYRWSMEYSVEYGLKPYYLMLMAKCAILNGEMALASKYLSTLSKTRNYKDFASKYTPYLYDKEARENDPQLLEIRALMCYRNDLYGDGGRVEAYYMPLTASIFGGSPQLMRLSMDANLIQKNVDGFMTRFQSMAKSMKHVPIHYQEAFLLWCNAHGISQDDPRTRVVDEGIKRRYNAFFEAMTPLQHLPEDEMGEVLRSRFGNTYWFYYFFTNNLHTI